MCVKIWIKYYDFDLITVLKQDFFKKFFYLTGYHVYNNAPVLTQYPF